MLKTYPGWKKADLPKNVKQFPKMDVKLLAIIKPLKRYLGT